jgi:cell fate regulator YaaT (PSP1 superfamily)
LGQAAPAASAVSAPDVSAVSAEPSAAPAGEPAAEATAPADPPAPSDAAQDYGQAPAPHHLPAVTETDKPTVIVRYGTMGLLGRFICTMTPWRCGQRVVIKSERGQEIGQIACVWRGCGAPGGVAPQIRGDVLRAATHADEVEERHLRESERREFAFCKQCVAQKNLPMKMVAVEHLFGGDRIIFYFVSETRVDFRALVRDLAHEFQTRIEMRQIGVRDEARLLGDYERCGRPLCCRAWIKELEPVSMKMAKIQKATLDPAKISGRCGRLMCCLRFEHTTYRDLAKNLPRKNTLVVTTEGPGKVIDTDVVSQMVAVLLGNGNRINVPVESLVSQLPGAAPPRPPAEADETAEGDAPVDMIAHRMRDGADAPAAEVESQAEAEAPAPAAAEPGAPASAAPPQAQPPRQGGGQRPGGWQRGGRQRQNGSQRQDSGPRQEGAPRQNGGPGQGGGQPGQGGGQPGQGGGQRQEGRGRRGRRRSRRGGRNRGNRGGGPGGGPNGPRPSGDSPPQTGAPPQGSPPQNRGAAPRGPSPQGN